MTPNNPNPSVTDYAELVASTQKAARALALLLVTVKSIVPPEAFQALKQKSLSMILEADEDRVNSVDGFSESQGLLLSNGGFSEEGRPRPPVPADGLKPGIDKSRIRKQYVGNKATRASFFIDVILLFLLANHDQLDAIILSDIASEFERIGYHQKTEAIRTRVSRMRKAGMLVPLKEGGKAGQYRLTEDGVRAAKAALAARGMA